MKIPQTQPIDLEQPRRETGRELLIAGLRARYSNATIDGIPAQWQRFGPYKDIIKGRIGRLSYGVCCEFDDSGRFDYVSGVEVSDWDDLPPEMSDIRIPARSYFVFRHRGHVSGIAATWRVIMDTWMPASGPRMARAPNFERYGEDFDADTGLGGVEI